MVACVQHVHTLAVTLASLHMFFKVACALAHKFAHLCAISFDSCDVPLQAASAISHMVNVLKDLRVPLSTIAWFRNLRQRCAFGLITMTASSITARSLQSEPAKVLGLEAMSAEDLALEAFPIAVRRPNHVPTCQSFILAGQIKGAKEYLRRAARNYPVEPQAWMMLGEIECFVDKRYSMARKYFRAAFEALAIAESHSAALASRQVDLKRQQAYLHYLRIQACSPCCLQFAEIAICHPRCR